MMDGTTAPEPGFIQAGRIKFPKRHDVLPPRIRRALRIGAYEAKEAKAVLRVVRADDVVLELGGGVGFISSLIGTHRKVKHIHVFEANSALAGYIRETHAANGIENATVHHAIMGKRKGKAEFHVRGNLVGSSLDKMDGAGVTHTETVDIRNAKAEIKAIKPDVLVCDIEGAEVDLIPLMDLSGLRAAVIELHPQWIGVDGVNAVFQAFMSAGLAYYPKLSNQKVVTFRRAWPLK